MSSYGPRPNKKFAMREKYRKDSAAARRTLTRLRNKVAYNRQRLPMVRNIPGVLRSSASEIKAVDITRTSTAFKTAATPPTPILLNGTITGANFVNRIGSKISMLNLHLRGIINGDSTVTKPEEMLRILIVYDRQTNKLAPILSDVLQNRDNANTPTTTVSSEVNLDNRDRFVILRDLQVMTPYQQWTANALNSEGGVSTQNALCINEFIKLNGMVTTYSNVANTGLVGDITTGSIIMFLIGTASDAWGFDWSSRLRFSDN